MKRIIYSTGVFETELIGFAPYEESCYDSPCWVTKMSRQRFELRKTSSCLMRYELEDGDTGRLDILRKRAEDAAKALAEHLMTASECRIIVDIYNNFADIYNQAVNKVVKDCEGVMYVELADETCKGCRAEYRFNDGVVDGVFPCKIGESHVVKLNL